MKHKLHFFKEFHNKVWKVSGFIIDLVFLVLLQADK